jgi:hypothetical protein
MDFGWDLTHGEAVERDRMRRFAGGVGADAGRFCDGRDGERIDERLDAIYAQRAMDGDCGWRRCGVIHAGHEVGMCEAGRLLRECGFEGSDLGCGEGCGAAAGFEEDFSARGSHVCLSFPILCCGIDGAGAKAQHHFVVLMARLKSCPSHIYVMERFS